MSGHGYGIAPCCLELQSCNFGMLPPLPALVTDLGAVQLLFRTSSTLQTVARGSSRDQALQWCVMETCPHSHTNSTASSCCVFSPPQQGFFLCPVRVWFLQTNEMEAQPTPRCLNKVLVTKVRQYQTLRFRLQAGLFSSSGVIYWRGCVLGERHLQACNSLGKVSKKPDLWEAVTLHKLSFCRRGAARSSQLMKEIETRDHSGFSSSCCERCTKGEPCENPWEERVKA